MMACLDTPFPQAPKEDLATVDELRDCALCGGLDDNALRWLTQHVERLELGPGTIIFREGDAAREFYLVLEGDVEIWKRPATAENALDLGECINMIHAKSIVGGSSVIDMQGRLATARAATPVVLLRVSCRTMTALYREDLKSYTMVILNVARDLSRRLRVVNTLAASLSAQARGGPHTHD